MNEESLFASVLERETPADRLAHLQSTCGDDGRLFHRMNLLLASHEQASGILDRTNHLNGVAVNSSPISELCGSVVGPYVLKDLLGEGGFGQVFVAEQYHPVRRDVAIKLIKPGMNSREVLARFEGERQALALMDHGNIARVFDAGTTEDGRPYFVMELVRGLPITEYADTMRLNTQARLKLFSSVCLAVHHAHQKGILHRDLKPSNVLVTTQDDQSVVKVIDFGVAKAVHQPLINDPFLTHIHQMIGTPAYMSPEQAGMNGQDVDTRTDIYSLGVLLYEVLVGATPFDRDRLQSAGYDEMRRIIREEEPLCPSTRICELGMMATTISSNRQASPRQLSQLCRGELDWIVMKAMDKDREQRYSSASELARDLKRYLDQEPVEASPPSSLYRFSKFLQRHRPAVLSAAAMILLLLVGVVGTSFGMLQAWEAQKSEANRAAKEVRERRRAELAEQNAKVKLYVTSAVIRFLRNDLLSQAAASDSGIDSHHLPNPNLTVREALDRAAIKLTNQFDSQPDAEAGIRLTIGSAYIRLGLYDKAIDQLQRSAQTFEKFLGPDDDHTMQAMSSLAEAYQHNGNIDLAVPIFEHVRNVYVKTNGLDNARSLTSLRNLAHAYHQAKRLNEALALHGQVYQIVEKKCGAEHIDALTSLYNISMIHFAREEFHLTVTVTEKLCESLHRLQGEEHPLTLASGFLLAASYKKLNQHDKSIPFFERLLPQYQKVLGESHDETGKVARNLGNNYRVVKRYENAIQILKSAHKAMRGKSQFRGICLDLRDTYILAGRKEDAVATAEEFIADCRSTFPANSVLMSNVLIPHGSFLIRMKDWKKAENTLREALLILANQQTEDFRTYQAMSLLAAALVGRAQHERESEGSMYEEAEVLLLKSSAGYSQHTTLAPSIKYDYLKCVDCLIRLYTATNKPEKAREWIAEKEKRASVR